MNPSPTDPRQDSFRKAWNTYTDREKAMFNTAYHLAERKRWWRRLAVVALVGNAIQFIASL